MNTAAAAAGGQPATPASPTIPVICDKCRAQGSAGGDGFSAIGDLLNFEPVPRRTQVNNWTPELQRAYVAALAITGSPKRAGKAIGRHEYGAEKLRKARGGKSFDEACEAAMEIYREREMTRLAGQMGQLSNLSLEQAQTMDLKPGERDEDEEQGEYEAAQARIQDRLLRGRRLYLLSICNNAKKREAWEKLCGPVDWDKAVRLEPQDNEPYPARMVKPDMLLTVEGGCLPELTPGCRNRGAEFLEAMDEIREMTEANPDAPLNGPKTRRFFDGDAVGEEG